MTYTTGTSSAAFIAHWRAREDALGRGPRRMVDLVVAKNRFGEADRKVGLSFNPALGDFGEEART